MLPSWLRVVFLVYFATHIPATLLIDGQAALGQQFYPQALTKLLQFHIDANHDVLMAEQPVWFKSLIWVEVLLQLPFLFVALYAFAKRKNWVRIPSIIYGTQCATSLVPILADILFSGKLDSPSDRLQLAAVYMPYLVVPLLLVASMAVDPTPFGKEKRK